MVNFLHHSDMIRIFPPIYSNAFLKLTACTTSVLHLTFFEKTMDKGDVILFSQKTPFHYLLFKNLSNFSHYNIIRNCLKAHLVNKGEMSCMEQKKLIFFSLWNTMHIFMVRASKNNSLTVFQMNYYWYRDGVECK